MLPARNPYLDWVRVGDGDVLHAHEARAAYWAGLRGAAFARPYVITRRVLNPLSHSRLTRRVHAGAAAVVGVSRAVCELIGSDSAREGVCIHDAHQDLVCDPDRVREIRQSLGGGPIIGQVAALVDHRKGQSAAIAAFARLRERFAGARLVFVGEGPDRALLEEKARGIEGIVFAGYREDVANWTGALDLVVYPSARDALASSLLDAMHLGVPVVANRVGGIPEIARHEDTALLTTPGDVDALSTAMAALLEDAALRGRIVGNARRLAATLGADAMAEAYLAVYRKAIGQP